MDIVELGKVILVLAFLVFLFKECFGVFSRKAPPLKDTPYDEPMTYSIQLLKKHDKVGLIKALRECYPCMPLVVANGMVREGRVELKGSLNVHGVTRLVNHIYLYASDAPIRIVLDGTDVAFSLREWKESHHDYIPT